MAGFFETPQNLGGVTVFSNFLSGVFGKTLLASGSGETVRLIFASLMSMAGIALAGLLYLGPAPRLATWAAAPAIAAFRNFFQSGWGFDLIYNLLIITPFLTLIRINRHDIIDKLYRALAQACALMHRLLQQTQTGRIRWYAGWLAAGSIVTLGVAVLR